MVFGPVTGFTVMAYPMTFLTMGMRAVFTGFSPTPEESRKINEAFHNLGSVAILAAFISAIIGMVHVFSNLNKPDNIGPGVAVAFVSLLYGFGFKLFVALPVEAATTEKPKVQNEEGHHEHHRSSTSINRAA